MAKAKTNPVVLTSPATINTINVDASASLQFNASVTDVTDMIRTEARDMITEQRSAVQSAISQLQKRRNGVLASMAEAGKVLTRKMKNDPQVHALATAMREFSNEEFTVELTDEECDNETLYVKATVGIKKEKSYYGSTTVIEREVKAPYTGEMLKMIDEIKEIDRDLTVEQEKLAECNKCLQDLPVLVDRAKAVITRSVISSNNGKINREDLLKALSASTRKALPALTAK